MIQERKILRLDQSVWAFLCPLTWAHPRTSLVTSIPTESRYGMEVSNDMDFCEPEFTSPVV
jgi:hypothetical protein